jgi:4'-phosphopantetheinyl transferase
LDDSKPADRIAAGWPLGPLRPHRPAAEVHLWIADLEASGWPTADGLPTAERERAGRILDPESTARWAASHWALRTVLARYLDEEPAMIALEASEIGKPRIAGAPARLEFNLSHSGARALIAVSDRRKVGVDIERIKPGRDFLALAERSFEPAAVEAVRAAAPLRRSSAFYNAWVHHEALAKCDGGGLSGRVGRLPLVSESVDVGSGYAAAVAIGATTFPPLHKWSIQPPRAESVANLQS